MAISKETDNLQDMDDGGDWVVRGGGEGSGGLGQSDYSTPVSTAPDSGPVIRGWDTPASTFDPSVRTSFDQVSAAPKTSVADRLRDAVSMDVGGGKLRPEIGGGKVGFSWNRVFAKGGKVSTSKMSTHKSSKTHSSW